MEDEIDFYGYLSTGIIAFCESKLIIYTENSLEKMTLEFVGSSNIRPIGIHEQITISNIYLGNRRTFTKKKMISTLFIQLI